MGSVSKGPECHTVGNIAANISGFRLNFYKIPVRRWTGITARYHVAVRERMVTTTVPSAFLRSANHHSGQTRSSSTDENGLTG